MNQKSQYTYTYIYIYALVYIHPMSHYHNNHKKKKLKSIDLYTTVLHYNGLKRTQCKKSIDTNHLRYVVYK